MNLSDRIYHFRYRLAVLGALHLMLLNLIEDGSSRRKRIDALDSVKNYYIRRLNELYQAEEQKQ
jgi:hypothetical protein